MRNAKRTVVRAAPASLSGGGSAEVFEMWARDPRNAVLFPGVCTAGTLGHDLQNNKRTFVFGSERVKALCRVQVVGLSAHTDSKGILQLVHQTRARGVCLVHGQEPKMRALTKRIATECESFVRSVQAPRNGAVATFREDPHRKHVVSTWFEDDDPFMERLRVTKKQRRKRNAPPA